MINEYEKNVWDVPENLVGWWLVWAGQKCWVGRVNDGHGADPVASPVVIISPALEIPIDRALVLAMGVQPAMSGLQLSQKPTPMPLSLRSFAIDVIFGLPGAGDPPLYVRWSAMQPLAQWAPELRASMRAAIRNALAQAKPRDVQLDP